MDQPFTRNTTKMNSLQLKYSRVCFILFLILQTYPAKVFAKTNITLVIIDGRTFGKTVASKAISAINSNENILPNVELKLFQQTSPVRLQLVVVSIFPIGTPKLYLGWVCCLFFQLQMLLLNKHRFVSYEYDILYFQILARIC